MLQKVYYLIKFHLRQTFTFNNSASRTGSGAYLATYPMGTGVPFPAGKSDHSPPSTTKLKNTWSYTFTSPYVFMA